MRWAFSTILLVYLESATYFAFNLNIPATLIALLSVLPNTMIHFDQPMAIVAYMYIIIIKIYAIFTSRRGVNVFLILYTNARTHTHA